MVIRFRVKNFDLTAGAREKISNKLNDIRYDIKTALQELRVSNISDTAEVEINEMNSDSPFGELVKL